MHAKSPTGLRSTIATVLTNRARSMRSVYLTVTGAGSELKKLGMEFPKTVSMEPRSLSALGPGNTPGNTMYVLYVCMDVWMYIVLGSKPPNSDKPKNPAKIGWANPRCNAWHLNGMACMYVLTLAGERSAAMGERDHGPDCRTREAARRPCPPPPLLLPASPQRHPLSGPFHGGGWRGWGGHP